MLLSLARISLRGFPRMVTTVFLLDEFLVDVRIDLRGADIGVAEQFL